MRQMTRYAGFVFLAAGLAGAARGDATLRYHTDVQTSAMIPSAPLDGIRDVVVQIKGNHARSSLSNFLSIMDLKTRDVTIVDAFNKRFATVSAGQYAEQVKVPAPVVPEAARAMLASMKTSLESRATGRTETIQGIQTEEHEFVLNVEMAVPGGPPAGTPFLKMTLQIWTAKPEEVKRVPALNELKAYTESATSALNPAEMLKQVTAAIPGMGENLLSMIDEMSKQGGMALRTRTEVSMPFLALLSQQMPQQTGQALPPGMDPKAPLLQTTQELVEISTGELDEALFKVPAGYQPAPLDAILKGAATPPPPQFKQ